MSGTTVERVLLERALLPDGIRNDVLVEIAHGRFTSVTPDARVTDGGETRRGWGEISPQRGRFPRISGETDTLPGLTIPGLANTHSHAFHRALRGRTQRGRGTFWTWREQMYDVAARLTPELYYDLAQATYAEMAGAGITTVGEFHYLHHQPGGTPYAEPNAMGEALIAAARAAGLRIALLDTCYLSSGFGAAPEGVQRRFSDGTVEAWAARAAQRSTAAAAGDPDVVLGHAIHSVRAVPAEALCRIADHSAGLPLHVHLSEQPAENDACLATHGVSPARLLADHGCLGPTTTAVHATHLTADDIATLGATRTYVSFCPTTERDLGDGIGPSRDLHASGARLTLGSDSHAVIDPFEEMRAVELHERLSTRRRGHWAATDLLTAATQAGHQSLGFDAVGIIAPGQRADLVTLDTRSPRTAGSGADEHTAVFAATAADVVHVVRDGRVIARRGDAAGRGRRLATCIDRLFQEGPS